LAVGCFFTFILGRGFEFRVRFSFPFIHHRRNKLRKEEGRKEGKKKNYITLHSEIEQKIISEDIQTKKNSNGYI